MGKRKERETERERILTLTTVHKRRKGERKGRDIEEVLSVGDVSIELFVEAHADLPLGDLWWNR